MTYLSDDEPVRDAEMAALVHPPADGKPWIAGTLLVLVLIVLPGLIYLV